MLKRLWETRLVFLCAQGLPTPAASGLSCPQLGWTQFLTTPWPCLSVLPLFVVPPSSLLKGLRWADFSLGILDESSAAFALSGFGALPPPRLLTRYRHSSRARTYSSFVAGTERENAGWDGPFLLLRFANRSPFMFNPLAALVSVSILVLDSIKAHVSAQ